MPIKVRKATTTKKEQQQSECKIEQYKVLYNLIKADVNQRNQNKIPRIVAFEKGNYMWTIS